MLHDITKLSWLLGLCSLLIACSSSQPPIKVGSNVWPGYALYYLAEDQGWIATDDVRLIEYQSASFVSEALMSGDLDAAMLTLDEAMRIHESGQEITIIQVIDVSRGADVVISQLPLVEIDDFQGKSIAVERSAVGALMLYAFIDHFDLKQSDLEVIDISIDRSGQVFKQGIDFIVSFSPFSDHILDQGGYQIFDTSLTPNLVVDVLVVRNNFLADQYKEALTRLVEGFFEARQFLHEHPESALPYLMKRLKLNRNQVSKSYDTIKVTNLAQNRGMLSGNHAGLSYIMKKVNSVLVDAGYLKNSAPERNFYTDQYLPRGQ